MSARNRRTQPRRLHDDPRLRRRPARDRAPPRPRAPDPAPPRRGRARPRPRRRLGEGPLPRRLPARRAHGPRRARRHAGDRHHLDGAHPTCTAPSAPRCRQRSPRAARPPVVMCHVSHLYPTGASLYFTFLARQQPGAELAQWQAAKQAASDGDQRRRRDDHPPPRRRPRPRAVAARPRSAPLGIAALQSGQGARRPGRDHEPRQAPPVARRAPGPASSRPPRSVKM